MLKKYLISLIGLFFPALALAGCGFGGSGFGGWMMPMFGGWGWGGMLVGWIIFLFVIISVVYLIARVFVRPDQDRGRGDDALAVLKRRYAKGEISKEDFERMKKDLE